MKLHEVQAAGARHDWRYLTRLELADGLQQLGGARPVALRQAADVATGGGARGLAQSARQRLERRARTQAFLGLFELGAQFG